MPTLYRIFGTLRLYKYKKVDSTLSFHLMRPSHCLTFKNRQRKAHNEYINILYAHNHSLMATIKRIDSLSIFMRHLPLLCSER